MIDSLKNTTKSINDVAISRLKNPIVSAFVLAWCTLHVKGIAIFLMLEKSEQIEILRNRSFDLKSDLGYPLLFASFYLIILPIISLLHELYRDETIDSRSKWIAKARINREIEVEKDYLRQIKHSNIQKYIDERKQVYELTVYLRQVIDECPRDGDLPMDNAHFFQVVDSTVWELEEVLEKQR
jgi:hypothetical protein